MTSCRQHLAEYQARLLSMLHAAENPAQALAAMQQIASETGLQDEVHNIDLRMIDVAMRLTKTWGVVRQHRATAEDDCTSAVTE